LEGEICCQERYSSIVCLGEALAGLPRDLGFPVSGFRVIVLGWQRALRAEPCDEIYCIGREAIANTCRHAGPTLIEAEIEYRPNEFRLAVRNNGCGVDMRSLQWERKGQAGLRRMQERAEPIGAQFRISTSTSLGTQVELRVPGKVAFHRDGEGGGFGNWMRSLMKSLRPWLRTGTGRVLDSRGFAKRQF
jgi:hypothetical protein